jgi:hypothetical protein
LVGGVDREDMEKPTFPLQVLNRDEDQAIEEKVGKVTFERVNHRPEDPVKDVADALDDLSPKWKDRMSLADSF